jgi:hypothetical protein
MRSLSSFAPWMSIYCEKSEWQKWPSFISIESLKCSSIHWWLLRCLLEETFSQTQVQSGVFYICFCKACFPICRCECQNGTSKKPRPFPSMYIPISCSPINLSYIWDTDSVMIWKSNGKTTSILFLDSLSPIWKRLWTCRKTDYYLNLNW